MRWKIFLIVSINFSCIFFPYNIIGCGPDADPYDYYTSFFNNDLAASPGFKPFYYTSLNFLYDEQEPVKTEEVLANEWAGHCGVPVTDKDAYDFVMKYSWKDLNNLYMNLEKKTPLKIPDSVQRNSMTRYFTTNNDLEGLGYVMFAKKAEVYTGGAYGEWENIKRDSIKMTGLVKNALQLHAAAKQDFYKLRYAFQAIRLSHYSGRYNDVVSYYDKFIESNKESGLIKQLSLSLKAGALFNLKRRKEAAYLFSKAFAMSPVKRVSNYLGFTWSVSHSENRDTYLSLCKNNEERAWMLGMFALENPNNELASLEKIYGLSLANPVLELLAIREINKIEDDYFTASLDKEKGGKAFYYFWRDSRQDTTINAAAKEAKQLAGFLHKVAGEKKTTSPALFENGAAYTSFMLKDYGKAKQYLTTAKQMKQSEKLNDQWLLTNLLVTINEKDKIDAAFEDQLLPSVQWLENKAKKDETWKRFYRSLMSEILAQRYFQQGDKHKEVLAIGGADFIYNLGAENADWGYKVAVDHMRSNLNSSEVEKLYALVSSKGSSSLEKYMISHNSINNDLVTDYAGTAYLREYNFDKAIEWFKRSKDKKALEIKKNPFIDILYDQEEQLAVEQNFTTTKIAFAEEMKKLLALAESDKTNAAKHLYKYALGIYNMTYYGHVWELVEYYRSGSDGYYIPKDATSFKKEYYGCLTAEKYFEKAKNASVDKNFQARALFMMAKSSQKQVHMPQYDEYPDNYDAYDAAVKKYFPMFKNNKYFASLVKDYGTTAFYKTAYTKCSYLRDFVKKR